MLGTGVAYKQDKDLILIEFTFRQRASGSGRPWSWRGWRTQEIRLEAGLELEKEARLGNGGPWFIFRGKFGFDPSNVVISFNCLHSEM